MADADLPLNDSMRRFATAFQVVLAMARRLEQLKRELHQVGLDPAGGTVPECQPAAGLISVSSQDGDKA